MLLGSVYNLYQPIAAQKVLYSQITGQQIKLKMYTPFVCMQPAIGRSCQRPPCIGRPVGSNCKVSSLIFCLEFLFIQLSSDIVALNSLDILLRKEYLLIFVRFSECRCQWKSSELYLVCPVKRGGCVQYFVLCLFELEHSRYS